jgi:3-oxoadipate enol-lactonase
MSQPPAASLNATSVRVHRTGSGPPLVLLHCLGVDRALWDIAAAGLAEKFALLSYDLPGHGRAPVPERSYSIEDLSGQLAALMAREGIARAHIAGISLGGLVAQHFAATNPQMVDRLILIDTTPRYVDEMRRMWTERAQAARSSGVASLTEGLLRIWFTDGFIAADPPAVRYVRQRFASMSGEGYALACEALGAADLRLLAERIDAPTLVVCGRDELPPFLDAALWLQHNIKGAELEWLSPARHASILEQPDHFCRVARAFLHAEA